MITSFDGYINAAKQRLLMLKTAARTSVAAVPFSVYDLAGNPGAGVLAGTSTAAGVVPTDLTAGHPLIAPFGAGAAGYLSAVHFGSSVACRITLYDLLFKAGAYSFNSNVNLAAQPSFVGRLPNNSYAGLELLVETVTAFTGNMSVAVGYTNQDGTAGRSTGVVATGVAPTVGRIIELPLQAGDSGLQKIDSVVGSVATVGTFNLLVARRLWSGRVAIANSGEVHGMERTGMPMVYADSAFMAVITPDSTSTGVVDTMLEVCNG